MDIPEDLVFQEILSKLPPKSLMRFKCVSKSWRTRISDDSSFVDAHLTHHTQTGPQLLFTGLRYIVGDRYQRYISPRQRMFLLSDEKSKAATEIDMPYVNAKDPTITDRKSLITIVDSCNGLVCLLQSCPKNRVILWNPATRQVRPLPCSLPPTGHAVLHIYTAGFGFGFDTASKDYKVVLLERGHLKNEHISVLSPKVFAKSGAVWRGGWVSEKPEIPNKKHAVAVEGALHWVVISGESLNRTRLASFDLHDEVLRYTNGPVDDQDDIQVSLCKWRDSLAAFTVFRSEMLMWESTSSGSVRSWNKIFKSIPLGYEMALSVWKERFVARRTSGCGMGTNWSGLWLFDLKSPHLSTCPELPDPCFLSYFAHSQACDYTESLILVF